MALVQINDEVMDKLGIIEHPEHRQIMADNLSELLSLRISNRLAETLDSSELSAIMDHPEKDRFEWMEHNVPHFHKIASEELHALMQEISSAMPL